MTTNEIPATPMTSTDKEKLSTPTRADSLDEMVRTIFIALAIALGIRMFAFEPFNIPSTSMVPGLLVGDYLFVSKYSYGYSSRSTVMGLLPFQGRIFFKQPARGDVAVFKLPRDNSTDYIKRVIGLPGDTVQMRHGILYVNGSPMPREKLAAPLPVDNPQTDRDTTDYIETFPNGHAHIIRKKGDDHLLDDTEVFTVPSRHYFMMGDNRDNSLDSRTTNVGFVPEENLVGRAEFLFFSLDENTHFWEIWKWPVDVRWSRIFQRIL